LSIYYTIQLAYFVVSIQPASICSNIESYTEISSMWSLFGCLTDGFVGKKARNMKYQNSGCKDFSKTAIFIYNFDPVSNTFVITFNWRIFTFFIDRCLFQILCVAWSRIQNTNITLYTIISFCAESLSTITNLIDKYECIFQMTHSSE